MIYPIFGRATTLVNSATRFIRIQGNHQSGQQTTAAAAEQVASASGTIKKWNISLGAAPGAGTSYDFTVTKNGVATSKTINIADAATTGTETATDVAFVGGDTLGVQIVPNSTPATGSYNQSFDVSGTTQVIFTDGSLSTSAARYFNLTAGSALSSTTDANSIISTAGTIVDGYGVLSAAPGVAKTYTATLVKNGVDTLMLFAFTGTGSGAGITTNSNLINTVSVVGGDVAYWRVDASGTPNAANITLGTAFTPTTDGESLAFSSTASNLATSGNNFTGAMVGAGATYATVEANRENWNTATAWIAKNLYATVDTTPASGSWAVTLRSNSANVSPAVTVTIAAGDVTKSDLTHSATVTASSLIGANIVGTSTPTATPIQLGWTFVDPATATTTSSSSSTSISISTSSTSTSISTSSTSTSMSTSTSISTSSTSISISTSSTSTSRSTSTSSTSSSISTSSTSSSISTSTSISISTSSTSSSTSTSISTSSTSTSQSTSTSSTSSSISTSSTSSSVSTSTSISISTSSTSQSTSTSMSTSTSSTSTSQSTSTSTTTTPPTTTSTSSTSSSTSSTSTSISTSTTILDVNTIPRAFIRNNDVPRVNIRLRLTRVR